jgi:hypothetical protein
MKPDCAQCGRQAQAQRGPSAQMRSLPPALRPAHAARLVHLAELLGLEVGAPLRVSHLELARRDQHFITAFCATEEAVSTHARATHA